MLVRKFKRYGLIGVLNTAVHWSVFALLLLFGSTQTFANGIGFFVAATVSYRFNAKFTFQQSMHHKSYIWFMLGMGGMSVAVGYLGDWLQWPGLVTLVVFSAISLVLGFIFSNYWVFNNQLK